MTITDWEREKGCPMSVHERQVWGEAQNEIRDQAIDAIKAYLSKLNPVASLTEHGKVLACMDFLAMIQELTIE